MVPCCVLVKVVDLLCDYNRQMFPLSALPAPTPILKKSPRCQQWIDRPRVNDTGKTFCKQMKKREKNRKEKQWLRSQMFTNENKQLCIIEYS